VSEAISSQLSAISYCEFADQLRYPEEASAQELYVQTFEFNPACTLEIGWHLFGENYERGEFLVRMRDQLRRHGIAESTELPDHLTHLLPLIGRMAYEEAAELAGQFVLPALAKIRASLHDNPYSAFIRRIEEKLETDFPNAPRRSAQLPIFQEAACE
jgi:nitrate reductase assembly molybdenum cofactor insertion protein NarJ